jgi:hypothetical protein
MALIPGGLSPNFPHVTHVAEEASSEGPPLLGHAALRQQRASTFFDVAYLPFGNSNRC